MARKRKQGKRESQVNALKVVTAGVKDLMLVSEMEETIWVPTLLTGYNRAVGIGGHPLGRVMILHGPEQVGKSVLAMIITESLRLAGHISKIDDTEFASEKEWYNLLTPNSILGHPTSLDEMREKQKELLDNLEKGKAARKKAERIPEEIGLSHVLDTISMLRPKGVMKKIEEEGIDKMFPLMAAWLTDWMTEIVPRFRRTNSSLTIVSQERENLGAGPYEPKWRVPHGKALKYDNCLRVRVKGSKKVKQGDTIVGMESTYVVANNKVDGTTWEEASFFTSNGRGDVPKGLDLVREAIGEAKRRKVMRFEGNQVTAEALTKHGEPVEMFTVKGGWENMRLTLMEDRAKFDLLVSELNRMARRTT